MGWSIIHIVVETKNKSSIFNAKPMVCVGIPHWLASLKHLGYSPRWCALSQGSDVGSELREGYTDLFGLTLCFHCVSFTQSEVLEFRRDSEQGLTLVEFIDYAYWYVESKFQFQNGSKEVCWVFTTGKWLFRLPASHFAITTHTNPHIWLIKR